MTRLKAQHRTHPSAAVPVPIPVPVFRSFLLNCIAANSGPGEACRCTAALTVQSKTCPEPGLRCTSWRRDESRGYDAARYGYLALIPPTSLPFCLSGTYTYFSLPFLPWKHSARRHGYFQGRPLGHDRWKSRIVLTGSSVLCRQGPVPSCLKYQATCTLRRYQRLVISKDGWNDR